MEGGEEVVESSSEMVMKFLCKWAEGARGAAATERQRAVMHVDLWHTQAHERRARAAGEGDRERERRKRCARRRRGSRNARTHLSSANFIWRLEPMRGKPAVVVSCCRGWRGLGCARGESESESERRVWVIKQSAPQAHARVARTDRGGGELGHLDVLLGDRERVGELRRGGVCAESVKERLRGVRGIY